MEVSFIPQWIIKSFVKGLGKQNDVNNLISNVLVILFFILLKNKAIIFINQLPHFCLFNRLTGINCPVCGTTRSFCELAKGNIYNAINLNFSSLFVTMFFAFQIPLRTFALVKNNYQKQINSLSKWLGNAVLLIIILSWVLRVI